MKAFLQSILERLVREFDPSAIGEGLAQLISNVTVGLIIFFSFYVIWRIANRLTGMFIRKTKIDATNASFIRTALKVVVLVFAAVQALSAMGINMAAIITSLGIAGLTIGFAARDALSNLISGILIFWDRPFIIGDLVEVENHYGRVERITLRSTRVVTVDGKMLAVPNATIIKSTVVSYTNFPHLRIDLTVTIAVTENIDRARKILLELAGDSRNILGEPPPKVVVTALNDYNVSLQLQVWIDNERSHLDQKFELRERIFKRFTLENIDMPFETIRITPLEIDRQAS